LIDSLTKLHRSLLAQARWRGRLGHASAAAAAWRIQLRPFRARAR